MTDYAKEPFDFKRFFLLNGKKFWKVPVTILLLTGICLLACFLKTKVFAGPTIYLSETMYEIEFEPDLFEKMQHYYNDYTWNEIIDSDAVAGRASISLGNLSKEEVGTMTNVPTMSDLVFFWIQVRSTDKAQAENVQSAMEKALKDFADETPALQNITAFDQKEVRIEQPGGNYLGYGAGGVVLGLIIGLLLLWYGNATDNGIYTEKDAESYLGLPVYGVTFKGDAQVEGFHAPKEKEAIIEVIFGQNAPLLQHQIMEAKAENKPFKGVAIVQADPTFYKKYYGVKAL